jgi:RND family efflux transporter MFP subunit
MLDNRTFLISSFALVLLSAGVWFSRSHVAVAAAATAASGVTSTGSAPGASASAVVPAAQSVTVLPVQRRDVPVIVEAPGTVVPLQTVELRAQVSGVVREVLVREGQAVRRGEPLFQLDDRNERANLDKARAQLLRDRATLADLERQLQRARELRGQGFIAQSAADSSATQVEAQQALIRSDEAAVQSAEVALGFTRLTAPLSGRVGQIAVHPGSLVQPGGVALLTIHQIDPVGVSFPVPEAHLSPLLALAGISSPGPAAAVGKPRSGAAATELAVLLPLGGERRRGEAPHSLPGRLVFVDNAVDTASGTILVKGSLANPRQQLWPGQYVSVRLTLRTLEQAQVIPQAAVIQRGAERSVYVVAPDGSARPKVVQLRQSLGELIAVEGLDDGDRVVVEGKQNLRPGTPLRIAVPASAGAASGGTAGGTAGGATAASAAASASRGASR